MTKVTEDIFQLSTSNDYADSPQIDLYNNPITDPLLGLYFRDNSITGDKLTTGENDRFFGIHIKEAIKIFKKE